MIHIEKRPKIICLTPVKNEAWILDKFLKATSLWADHIIIADQYSTDNTREIAQQFEKVILVENKSEAFDEPGRQKLLLSEARKFEGSKLLITLDADEFFTPNFQTSPEWETMLKSKPGTIIKFRLNNLHSDFQRMKIEAYYSWGYVDDGAEHEGRKIHSARIPLKKESDVLMLNDIQVIHLYNVNTERQDSKSRWYQCYERVTFPQKKSIEIFRMYDEYLPPTDFVVIPKEWKVGYKELNIDITSVSIKASYWWDEKVLEYFDLYGTRFFVKENIWKVDWSEKAFLLGMNDVDKYKMPGGKLYKKIRTLIHITQKDRRKVYVRLLDRALTLFLGY